MYICDCHCDTLTRLYKEQTSMFQNKYHLDIKRILENGGGLQFFAMFLPSEYRYCNGAKYTIQMIDKYYQELDLLNQKQIDYIMITSAGDVEQITKHKIALLLTIEEGGAIEGSLEILRIFYRLGVRCMTLTWSNRNDIADGVNEDITGGGLTHFGRKVVKEMNRLGMLVDVSHISPRGFWDVLDVSVSPIIASHSNASSVCNVPRNLTDDQIKAIAAVRGVIGINFCPDFLTADYKTAKIDDIYRHIDYILNLTGDDYIAFGSDFDGIDYTPAGVAGIENMPDIIDYLSKKYSCQTLEKLCYRNVLRLLKEVL